ncbi:MAG: hypothetical protein C0467_30470 [Planctomycetaceae bacterium]|nr:hypothetical protein [Planctomycetaceae bacterium]
MTTCRSALELVNSADSVGPTGLPGYDTPTLDRPGPIFRQHSRGTTELKRNIDINKTWAREGT